MSSPPARERRYSSEAQALKIAIVGTGAMARPSVLLDLLARKKSEIGVINGSIHRVAQELGSAAPVNEAITALVLAKERALGCR